MRCNGLMIFWFFAELLLIAQMYCNVCMRICMSGKSRRPWRLFNEGNWSILYLYIDNEGILYIISKANNTGIYKNWWVINDHEGSSERTFFK